MRFKQQELFHRARMIKYNSNQLISFVQNDLIDLYHKGAITSKSVDVMRKQLESFYQEFTSTFNEVIEDIDQYMQDVIDTIESNPTSN